MIEPEFSATTALCTACGLCCSGAIFNQLLLSGQDLQPAFQAGLEIADTGSGPALCFPCSRLEGTRCGIYQQRPPGCGAYRCELLKQVEADATRLDGALETVARALAAHSDLLEALGEETVPAFRTRRADAWFDLGEALPLSAALDRLVALDAILDAEFRRPEQNMTKPFDEPEGR